MLRIFSAGWNGELLHIVHRLSDFPSDCVSRRQDISDPKEPLQLAALDISAGTTYKPHTHLVQSRPDDVTQEAWIIVQGSVEVSYYDLDGSLLQTVTLGPGDCSITFRGGHGYRIISGPVRVYELKTGPYRGQQADKRFI